jgi:hypothetical protein
MDPKLPPDFVDLLTEFAASEVRYLVIGGYAVGFHDRPRATKDLDLLVGGDAENVRRACEALDAFGVTSPIVEAFRAAADDEIVCDRSLSVEYAGAHGVLYAHDREEADQLTPAECEGRSTRQIRNRVGGLVAAEVGSCATVKRWLCAVAQNGSF